MKKMNVLNIKNIWLKDDLGFLSKKMWSFLAFLMNKILELADVSVKNWIKQNIILSGDYKNHRLKFCKELINSNYFFFIIIKKIVFLYHCVGWII